ncbi:MAG: LysM peptidoglycan-binding domain-containing protein [Muribaculaceae bacterium]|nr:LysM peptidoglycan-binding domain-containing protein [Muribaculaceae bacterium]
MKISNRIICLAAAGALAWLGAMAKPAPSILSIKDTIHDNSVIVPESFETDVKKMQENWYLKNYAQLDRNADSRPNPVTTDQDYIDRLGLIPSVIEMPFNSIVKNFIVMYSERKRQLVENMLGMSLYYMPIFEEALERHGLPLELKYLPVIESALNPSAVSRAGAAGLWQFMPGTATQLGLEINSLVDMRRDPISSSEAAARYLKQLYGIFGDWSLAIASYNCGPGNVAKAIRRAGGGKKDFWEIYPFLPAETRGYVPAFIAANYVMNNYDKHNISPALARKPILTDTVHVSRRVHFRQISDVLAIPMDELRVLNPQFRTDLIPGDIRPYALVLPSLQTFAYIANEDSITNHNAQLYSRRDIVEPATGSISGSNSNGRYVDELVVKYHTVRKGETLAKIAKRYGVTVASIRKANGFSKKKKIQRGLRLKINTYKRRYIKEETSKETPEVSAEAKADSTAIERSLELVIDTVAEKPIPAENLTQHKSAENIAPKTETRAKVENTAKKSTPAKAAPATVSHKVTKGESLDKIARKYGVTVSDIRAANNIKGDKIQIGQTIKVPKKTASKTNSNSNPKSKKKRKNR